MVTNSTTLSTRKEPIMTRDGSVYIPYEERTGGTSTVYFTRDLSAEGLAKIYEKVN